MNKLLSALVAVAFSALSLNVFAAEATATVTTPGTEKVEAKAQVKAPTTSTTEVTTEVKTPKKHVKKVKKVKQDTAVKSETTVTETK